MVAGMDCIQGLDFDIGYGTGIGQLLRRKAMRCNHKIAGAVYMHTRLHMPVLAAVDTDRTLDMMTVHNLHRQPAMHHDNRSFRLVVDTGSLA